MSSVQRGAMLGRGGALVHPKSESQALLKAWRLLEGINLTDRGDAEERLRQAKGCLADLYEQVRAGYHANPTLVIHNPPIGRARVTGRGEFDGGRIVAKLSDDVHEIRYTHQDDGEFYRHEFNGEVEMFCVLRAGRRDVHLSHRDGKPLWDTFDV